MNTAVTNPLARGQIPKRSPSPQVSTFGEDLTHSLTHSRLIRPICWCS